MNGIITEWLNTSIENAPTLAIVGLIAWDLRAQFVKCHEEMRDTLDRVLTKILE